MHSLSTQGVALTQLAFVLHSGSMHSGSFPVMHVSGTQRRPRHERPVPQVTALQLRVSTTVTR
jgi:hypothetical protein